MLTQKLQKVKKTNKIQDIKTHIKIKKNLLKQIRLRSILMHNDKD
jgi:hypothetical protein